MALRPDARTCVHTLTHAGTSGNRLRCIVRAPPGVFGSCVVNFLRYSLSVDVFADAAEGSELQHSRSVAAFKVGLESELIPSGNPGKQGLLEVRPGLQAGDQACL